MNTTTRKPKNASINSSLAVVEESQPILRAQENSFDKLLKLSRPSTARSSKVFKKTVPEDKALHGQKKDDCTYKAKQFMHEKLLEVKLTQENGSKCSNGHMKENDISSEKQLKNTAKKVATSVKEPIASTVVQTRCDDNTFSFDAKEKKSDIKDKGTLQSFNHCFNDIALGDAVEEMDSIEVESSNGYDSDSTWKPTTCAKGPSTKRIESVSCRRKQAQPKKCVASSFTSSRVETAIQNKAATSLNHDLSFRIQPQQQPNKSVVATKLSSRYKNKFLPAKCPKIQEPFYDNLPLAPPTLEEVYQPSSKPEDDSDDDDGDETLKNEDVSNPDNEEGAGLGRAGVLPGFERLSEDSLTCKSLVVINECTITPVLYCR